MRRIFIIVCIAAQLLVLGVMAGKREFILATGERIFLRTAPIDPRDPFRGDFVRLRYDISTAAPEKIRGGLPEHGTKKGYPVYAKLAMGADDVYSLDYLSDEEPGDGIFLRGRLRRDWRLTGGGNAVAVDFGIEQLFVEQGSGRAIEQRRGTRNGLQVPMEVELAVSAGGTPVIRDFRWSRLGMGLKMLRFHQRDRNVNLDDVTEPLSPKLEITLQNVSDAPLTIVDPGNHCGFRLRATLRVSKQYSPLYEGCQDWPLFDDKSITLAPGEAYTAVLDLSEPRWHIEVDGKRGEIGRYANNDSFRIVYQAALADLSAADDGVWKGELPSSAFTAFRIVD